MEDTTQTQNNSGPQGWFTAAMIFAKALGFMIDEGNGVIVDLDENLTIEGEENVRKVLVFKKDNSIHIGPVEEEIPNGSFVSLGSEENEQEEQ
jgi:hypothetical protein